MTDRAANESVAELLIGDEAMPRFCRRNVKEAEGRRIRAGTDTRFGASLQHGHEDGPRGARRFELAIEFGVVAESYTEARESPVCAVAPLPHAARSTNANPILVILIVHLLSAKFALMSSKRTVRLTVDFKPSGIFGTLLTDTKWRVLTPASHSPGILCCRSSQADSSRMATTTRASRTASGASKGALAVE